MGCNDRLATADRYWSGKQGAGTGGPNPFDQPYAKKVASGSDPGSYNVVWQSLTNYAHSISFSWKTLFAQFATNVFDDGRMVASMTRQQTFDLGQTCELSEYGVLDAARTNGPFDGVTMENHYGPIHPALSQASVLNGP